MDLWNESNAHMQQLKDSVPRGAMLVSGLFVNEARFNRLNNVACCKDCGQRSYCMTFSPRCFPAQKTSFCLYVFR